MTITNRDLWIDPAEEESSNSKLLGHLLIGSICAILIVFLIWAHFAVLDQITRGDGKVIPSSQTQVVQNLDGGTLAEMRVREGDIVQKGQIVALIENTMAKYSYAEMQQRYYTGLAAVTRLQAEIDGKSADDLVFPEELLQHAPEVADAERALSVIRHNQLETQLATLRDQLTQREQEIQEIETKIRSAQAGLALAQQEVAILKPLVATGATSKVDLLKAQRDMQQYQSEVDNATSTRPRVLSALEEAKSKINEAEAAFRADAAQQLAKQRADLATVKETMAEAGAKYSRTEVMSPVHGTVKEIKIRTVGGVIQPAQEIMEIVPIEDTLLIEAQIRPQDRGFIAAQQKAKVKITAYDYSIYGGLDAKVEQISADAIENEKKEMFFRVRLRTDRNYLLDRQGQQLPIIPGMTATVDILTGKKTVLEYLLKPILKASQTALTER